MFNDGASWRVYSRTVTGGKGGVIEEEVIPGEVAYRN